MSRTFLRPSPAPPLDPLSLHDALPISPRQSPPVRALAARLKGTFEKVTPRHSKNGVEFVKSRTWRQKRQLNQRRRERECGRSEEHTSELQSLRHLVCRLLLEKKNKRRT